MDQLQPRYIQRLERVHYVIWENEYAAHERQNSDSHVALVLQQRLAATISGGAGLLLSNPPSLTYPDKTDHYVDPQIYQVRDGREHCERYSELERNSLKVVTHALPGTDALLQTHRKTVSE